MPDGLRLLHGQFELTGSRAANRNWRSSGWVIGMSPTVFPQKLPLLKTTDADEEVDFRKRTVHPTVTCPMASFIGTSNHKDLLTDPTGSRRYLCAEVKEK